MVYDVIRNYLLIDNPAALDVEAIEAREQGIRRDAQRRARTALRESPRLLLHNAVFHWVLKNARMGVKNRENMRFARTRIFGLLREILRAIGCALRSRKRSRRGGRHIYLTIDEVWDFVKGTAVTTDLRGLAHLRQAEFEGYRQETTTPDDRFNTYGMAYHRNLFQNHNAETAQSTDGMCGGSLLSWRGNRFGSGAV